MTRTPATATSRRRTKAPPHLCLLVLLAATATGCGPAATPTPRPSPTAAGSPSPAATHSGTDLLAGFPIMPGATEDPDRPTATGLIGAWHTDAESWAVYAYYLAQLPGAGFVVDGAFPGGAAAVILFRTPSGDRLQLALERAADGGTDFQVLPPDPG